MIIIRQMIKFLVIAYLQLALRLGLISSCNTYVCEPNHACIVTRMFGIF